MRTGHKAPVELTQAELQVEEGQPTKDQHGGTGDENRIYITCRTDPDKAPGTIQYSGTAHYEPAL
jgi:hypothetical protein